ncbi:MAG: hypothetical protein ACTHYZ_04930 [Psychrobacter sp.]
MSESAIKNSELEQLGIVLEEQVLEIGVQNEYADKIAAEYVEKLASAKGDKNSVLYKSSKVKERYKQSDLHQSINRIINKIEPLRVAIIREHLVLKQAVSEGNKQAADESIKAIAKNKMEKGKLEKNLNALMSSANKLKLAS